MRIFRILLVLIVVVLIIGSGLFLVKRKQKILSDAPRGATRPTPIRVVTARRGNFQKKQDYLSVVEPIRLANVSARVTSTVEKVLYDEDDLVKRKDVLIVLDTRHAQESITEVDAQIAQARSDLASNHATVQALFRSIEYWNREAKRDTTLADKGAIPKAQAEATVDKASETRGKLDAAREKSKAIEHLINSLKSRKKELETTLDYYTIRAPFDGVVSRRFVDPGDLAVPGKTLMVIETHGALKLSFDVPQQDISKVREGLEVVFSVSGKTREAKLSHMYPSLSSERMLRAEVYLAGREIEGLTSGAYIPISVVMENIRDVTLLPLSCLIESPNRQTYVFVVHEGLLKARPVKVLGSSGEEIAVKGVIPGELVVQNTFLGWAQLSSGQKVEIIE